MSSLIPNGRPVTRLLCLSCLRTRASIELGPIISLGNKTAATSTRHYAKVIRPIKYSPSATSPSRSPSRSPPPRPPPLPSSAKNDPPRLVFSYQDVPPLPEWTSSLEGFGHGDLTALECMEGAQRYVSVATQYESQWRDTLETKHNLSPYLLHWIGIILMCGNTAQRWRLGTHMLRSASEQDYAPSTLSLMRIFHSMPTKLFQERAARSNIYLSAKQRFHQIVKEGTDPDALTLQGIIFAKEGDGKRALVAFRRATKAWEKTAAAGVAQGISQSVSESQPDSSVDDSSVHKVQVTKNGEVILPQPREPRWEWEVSCVRGMADLLVKEGQTEEARKLYSVAALELDNPHAFLSLAKMMDGPPDRPERRTYMLKAAISGDLDACSEMATMERFAAKKEGISIQEINDHKMLSREWLRLAKGEDLTAVGQEEVEDL